MPKKDYSTGETIVSETGNWNVASDFSRVKIMIPLTKCEYFKDIATFGYEEIAEQLMETNVQNDLVRFTGLKRYINELLKICKNCKFAMKKGNTKKNLEDLEKKLDKIKKVINLLVNIRKNNVNHTKELIINNEKFDKVLEIVMEVESAINLPLNQNHLIFTDKEEFDPHAYKEQLKKRMIGKG